MFKCKSKLYNKEERRNKKNLINAEAGRKGEKKHIVNRK